MNHILHIIRLPNHPARPAVGGSILSRAPPEPRGEEERRREPWEERRMTGEREREGYVAASLPSTTAVGGEADSECRDEGGVANERYTG